MKRRAVSMLLVGSALLAGCGLRTTGLEFHADQRLHFTAPADLALVSTPVTLRWSVTGSLASWPGEFAVFVDRAPVKPGQSLAAVASGDPTCLAVQHCPNRSYLANHGVYTTDQPALRLRSVASRTNTADQVQVHDVTVVLLGTSGRRVGESFWRTSFRLRQPT